MFTLLFQDKEFRWYAYLSYIIVTKSAFVMQVIH